MGHNFMNIIIIKRGDIFQFKERLVSQKLHRA